MDLHRGLGGYALIFTGLHLATAYGADIGGGLAQVFVPGAAKASTTAYTLGVVAFYAIAVTVLTSWPKRRLGRKLWHAVHLLSIPAAVLAGMHAYQLGSEGHQGWYLGLSAVSAGVVMYPLGLRILGILRRHADRIVGLEPDPRADRELADA
jgi:DMSO/TMAO reductase YedYZ heme-binding membrane subunit